MNVNLGIKDAVGTWVRPCRAYDFKDTQQSEVDPLKAYGEARRESPLTVICLASHKTDHGNRIVDLQYWVLRLLVVDK